MAAESPRLRVALVIGLGFAGLLCGAPMLVAQLRYQVVRGEVLSILPIDQPDGRVRFSLAYQYTIVTDHGRIVPIGWAQGDRLVHPMDDPLLPSDQARVLADRLQLLPGGWVFYHANDPGGSAFIMLDARGGLRAYGAGLVLVLAALLLCIPLRKWSLA